MEVEHHKMDKDEKEFSDGLYDLIGKYVSERVHPIMVIASLAHYMGRLEAMCRSHYSDEELSKVIDQNRTAGFDEGERLIEEDKKTRKDH